MRNWGNGVTGKCARALFRHESTKQRFRGFLMGQVICNGNEWGERVASPHLFNRGITPTATGSRQKICECTLGRRRMVIRKKRQQLRLEENRTKIQKDSTCYRNSQSGAAKPCTLEKNLTHPCKHSIWDPEDERRHTTDIIEKGSGGVRNVKVDRRAK